MANYNKLLTLVAENLSKDESIKASVYGAYDGKLMGKEITLSAIFICTENRLVLYAKKLMGYDFETFPYKNISSLEKSKGIMGHTITIFAFGNKATIKWINQGEVQQFIDYVNSKISKQSDNNNQAYITNSSSNNKDIPTLIKKLSDLKEQGILTEEEFNSKKNELLSKI